MGQRPHRQGARLKENIRTRAEREREAVYRFSRQSKSSAICWLSHRHRHFPSTTNSSVQIIGLGRHFYGQGMHLEDNIRTGAEKERAVIYPFSTQSKVRRCPWNLPLPFPVHHESPVPKITLTCHFFSWLQCPSWIRCTGRYILQSQDRMLHSSRRSRRASQGICSYSFTNPRRPKVTRSSSSYLQVLTFPLVCLKHLLETSVQY